MSLFSEADREFLRRPHISKAWFGYFDLPSGEAFLHNGIGRVSVNGQEYRGVTDPVLGPLVSISAVDDPRFGQAAKVDIILAGVSSTFFASVKTNARAIEGRTANISFGMFDPETLEVQVFKRMFPGKMSSPTLHRKGIGERYITLTVESFWQSQNYPFGGKWSPAGQRQRFAGDKGMDFLGVSIEENWS